MVQMMRSLGKVGRHALTRNIDGVSEVLCRMLWRHRRAALNRGGMRGEEQAGHYQRRDFQACIRQAIGSSPSSHDLTK